MGRGVGKLARAVSGARQDVARRIGQNRAHGNLTAQGGLARFA